MAIRKALLVPLDKFNVGVPYSESFETLVQFYVKALGNGKCQIRISGGVEWTGKPPLIKGIILREVRKGQDRAFNIMLQMLTRAALGKRKSRTEGEEDDMLDMMLESDLQLSRREVWQKWLLYISVALALISILLGLAIANLDTIRNAFGNNQPP